MKIVYESKTGHTKKYAEMLAEKLKIDCIALQDYKQEQEDIIFLAWVFADQIKGYSKIKHRANIICTIAVGINPYSKENDEKLIQTNQVNTPFFYLPGGIDYTKLKGISKILLKLVTDQRIKENKPEDKEVIPIMKMGGSLVKEENLIPIMEYLTKK